ncbi:MAG: endonuclease SmrB [Idiomarina sp.]|nr:endonuclease SmrB [Idiomarina sp.]
MSDDTPDDQINDQERALFRQAMAGTRKLVQDDNIVPHHITSADDRQRQQAKRKRQAATSHLKQTHREHASHPFSSQFEPALPEGIMKYTADGANPYLTKQLRRGDFSPDLMVDLHGLTQAEAQQDLAAAVTQCIKQQGFCLNVIHGVGSGVLRQRVPGWLMQHPEVIAFHQAPLEWGGQGALLVLLKSTLLDWRDTDQA